MFSRTWREVLRKLQAGSAVHPAIVRHGIGGGQYTRKLHQVPGSGCSRAPQPFPRSFRDVGCGFPYSAGGLRRFQRAASTQKESSQGDLATQEEDPFDPLTDRIPEKPVTVAEGASYSIVILAGLAVAGAAAYAVFKELILQPKEYKIFGKALERVQKDNEVTVRLGSPITGYGQESRNRAARQRIANRTWTDEDGVERCEVVFYIRGPQGAGKVHSEMYKDKADRTWKFTYLIVDVTNPYPTRLMLESYIPSLPAATAA